MKISDTIIGNKDLNLVEFMEEVQTLLNNGLMELRIVTSVPTWAANEGEVALYVSGSNRQLYFMAGGSWITVGFSSAGGLSMFDVDGDTGITPELTANDNILRFYTNGYYNFSMTTEGFSVANALKVMVRSNDTYMFSSAGGYLALVAGTQIEFQANCVVTGTYGYYGDGSHLTGVSGLVAGGAVPVGSELVWAGASGSVPETFLYTDGTSLLRAGTYATLFGVIGTAYGSADATHFNIPNTAGYIIKAYESTAAVLGITGGGTGQDTAQEAIDALLPSQTGNSGKFLTTDGTNSSWGSIATYSSGSTYTLASATTERQANNVPAYVKIKECYVSGSGTVSVFFDLKSGNPGTETAYARIYTNGVASGTERSSVSGTYVTYTESISVSGGDLVQLYYKCAVPYNVAVRNFYIRSSQPDSSGTNTN